VRERERARAAERVRGLAARPYRRGQVMSGVYIYSSLGWMREEWWLKQNLWQALNSDKIFSHSETPKCAL
jgi:hypothetical protein